MLLEPGQVYGGKYRILRELGAGSMGAVYEGENILLHRKLAIKALHPGIASKTEVVERFEREAQAAGRIGSEHIVEVLDMGDLSDGTRYLVMEFLDGSTLEDRIRSRGRLKPEDACPIVVQLLEGLEAAHAAGIIHRDLKPANVFLEKNGDFVKILDFGISKFNVLNEEMSMTRTGMVLGTPYYMSPEQAKGSREVDPRSDLYAVGVIIYECITGQLPFSAETFNELLFRIVLESPPPAETYVPDLNPEFAAVIRKAMAREPTERFQSATEFKATLLDWYERNKPGAFHPVNQTIIIPGGQLDGGATRVMTGGAPIPPGVIAAPQPVLEPPPPAAPLPVEGSNAGLSASLAGDAGLPTPGAPRSALLGVVAGVAVIGGILGGVLFWRSKASAAKPPDAPAAEAASAKPSEPQPSDPKPSEPKPSSAPSADPTPSASAAAPASASAPPVDPPPVAPPPATVAGPEPRPAVKPGEKPAKPDKPGDKPAGKPTGAPTAAPAATAAPAGSKPGGRVVSSDL